MNNQFKILWFEDNSSWYKTALRRVKNSIASHFLQDAIIRKPSGDVLNIKELKEAKYDLILMDYKLSEESPNGDEIIKYIRDNLILTDILFYSSDEKNMIASFRRRIPEMDGVYLAKRNIEEFAEKTERLISKIVQRSEDIINLRGMVLEATSFFETKVQSFLDDLWENIEPDEQEVLNNLLKTKILDHRLHDSEDKIKKFDKKKFDVPKANKKGYFMNEKLALIDAFSKKNRNDVIFASIDKKIQDLYMEKLGRYRNKLGHVNVGEEIEIGENEKEIINQEFHKKMRRNIAELNDKFEKTLNLLLKPT